VKIQSVSEDIATALGLPENTGALVAAITPGGPAAKAGVLAGDVVVKFDGEEVSGMRTLPRLVARAPVDKQVDVDILRKGQKQTLKVVVGRLAEDDEPRSTAAGEPGGAVATTVLGLKLSELTDELRAKYGIAPGTKGAIVDSVDPKSPAADSIKAGDVIVQAANEPVSTPQELAKRVDSVKKSSRKSVMLEVEDAKGSHRFVSVPVE
jgi:serine protease Do